MLRLFPSKVFKLKLNNSRYFPNKKFSDKPENVSPNPKESPPGSHQSSFISQKLHAPSKLERTILVWTGMYKSKEEIPKKISIEAIEKARNKARIKVSNYMILATAIGCVIVAISGRRAAQRGESVAQMNLDWHKQIKEDSQK